jgi:hypothetical protein
MSDSIEDPEPPDTSSDALMQQVDSVELPELKALLSSIEHRIEALRTPIGEEIEATAAAEVLQINNHGA